MRNHIYNTLRKYIGPLELVISVVVIAGISLWLDRREEQKAREQFFEELQRYTTERERMDKYTAEYAQPVDMDVKVLDSIYAPYMIDSLCRYMDSTFTRGYVTMSKQAPYQKLIAQKDSFYMWIQQERYFPEGKLVNVTGVAQNDHIIQFHFFIDQEEQTLDGMMQKLEETLQELQKPEQ